MLPSRGNLPCLKNIPSFQQIRCKHQNVHRTIAVKLLQDIPGVGERSSIQSVAPGRMRHVFYPRKQAAYIIGRPKKDLSTRLPQPARKDHFDVKDRLLSLKPLVFQRITHTPSITSIVTESHKLKSPVTSHDVVQRLEEYIDMDLAPLNANVVFQGSTAADRVDSTGEHRALVHLSTGDIFSINVRVEPKPDAKQLLMEHLA